MAAVTAPAPSFAYVACLSPLRLSPLYSRCCSAGACATVSLQVCGRNSDRKREREREMCVLRISCAFTDCTFRSPPSLVHPLPLLPLPRSLPFSCSVREDFVSLRVSVLFADSGLSFFLSLSLFPSLLP